MSAILNAAHQTLGRWARAALGRLAREDRPPGLLNRGRNQRRDGRRPLRSYALRSGRISPAQSRAVRRHWARWGLRTADGLLEPQQVFGRRAPLVFEVGFGAGEALLDMAQSMPERDFLGADVYFPGIGRLFRGMAETGTDNIRVYAEDAIDVLEKALPSASLEAAVLLFPDPWPKKRHHKRRLVQEEFLSLVADRLRAGGLLQIATDWEAYAERILEQAEQSGRFTLLSRGRPPWRRVRTRFEERALREGREVREMLFERRA